MKFENAREVADILNRSPRLENINIYGDRYIKGMYIRKDVPVAKRQRQDTYASEAIGGGQSQPKVKAQNTPRRTRGQHHIRRPRNSPDTGRALYEGRYEDGYSSSDEYSTSSDEVSINEVYHMEAGDRYMVVNEYYTDDKERKRGWIIV